MNITLKCMILDDDPMACKALERLCRRHVNLELAGICHHATEAVEFMEKNHIDLLFLDVEMPEYSGIDFLNMAPYLPMVIFTTSKPKYAVEAFSYNALDYLVKPVTMPGFDRATDKALRNFVDRKVLDGQRSSKQMDASAPTDASSSVPTSSGATSVVPATVGSTRSTGMPASVPHDNKAFNLQAEYIYVREDRRYVRLDCDTIQYFENVGDYVRIKTTAATHIIHGTLKSIGEKLPTQFLRVHRSYIVNLDLIKDIEESTLVIHGKVIPISRTHKSELMGRLKVL